MGFFNKLFDSGNSQVNSKILSVFVALVLLIVVAVFILLGIPPVTATYTTDLLWGLVTIIIGQSGIQAASQFGKGQN